MIVTLDQPEIERLLALVEPDSPIAKKLRCAPERHRHKITLQKAWWKEHGNEVWHRRGRQRHESAFSRGIRRLWLVDGLRPCEIARKLGCHRNTVNYYLRLLRRELYDADALRQGQPPRFGPGGLASFFKALEEQP